MSSVIDYGTVLVDVLAVPTSYYIACDSASVYVSLSLERSGSCSGNDPGRVRYVHVLCGGVRGVDCSTVNYGAHSHIAGHQRHTRYSPCCTLSLRRNFLLGNLVLRRILILRNVGYIICQNARTRP